MNLQQYAESRSISEPRAEQLSKQLFGEILGDLSEEQIDRLDEALTAPSAIAPAKTEVTELKTNPVTLVRGVARREAEMMKLAIEEELSAVPQYKAQAMQKILKDCAAVGAEYTAHSAQGHPLESLSDVERELLNLELDLLLKA